MILFWQVQHYPLMGAWNVWLFQPFLVTFGGGNSSLTHCWCLRLKAEFLWQKFVEAMDDLLSKQWKEHHQIHKIIRKRSCRVAGFFFFTYSFEGDSTNRDLVLKFYTLKLCQFGVLACVALNPGLWVLQIVRSGYGTCWVEFLLIWWGTTSYNIWWVFPKNRKTPKWMVYNGKPY